MERDDMADGLLFAAVLYFGQVDDHGCAYRREVGMLRQRDGHVRRQTVLDHRHCRLDIGVDTLPFEGARFDRCLVVVAAGWGTGAWGA